MTMILNNSTILTTKKNILLSFLMLFSAGLFAQGLTKAALTVNGPLIAKHDELQKKSLLRSGGSIRDTLSLGTAGFVDDFAYDGPYPDTALWLNNSVYVNRDLPIAPPTLGVATFDGLNANGYPYDFLAGQYTTGKADTLTSKPIDLYLPGDTSVYFSFYYQAQGRGNFPDRDDSLILEFKNVFSGSWDHVWATPGITTDITDSAFKMVMMHVTDSVYLQKGFQFRFTNWATLSGNGDHWHIDDVYLNKNRSDTLLRDIAFVYNTPSLLNTYSVMPWEQYTASYMKTVYSTTIRNNNPSTSFGGNFEYRIFDENNVQVNTTYNAGAVNFDPYATSGYISAAPVASPPINYTIPALTGKTNYTIETSIAPSPSEDRLLGNDTIRHKQEFDNYYAYDDGTAEVSFGLIGFLHAQLAEKYTTTVDDSLRAVDIYFNPQWTDASLFTFKLKVWGVGGSGNPGTVLYIYSLLDTPAYNQSGRNAFTRYYLEHPLFLGGGTTFFVGFDQNTTQPINIGVDMNTNSQDKTYYSTSGTWYTSPFPGSLMIHPILGSAAGAVGIATYDQPDKNKITVFPNPATNKLYLRSTTPVTDQKTTYTVIDMYGRTVLENTGVLPEYIDISNLSNGIYFVRIVNNNDVSLNKFIISN